MSVDMFWNIVEASRADIDPNNADGNMERQCATLMRLLSGMTPGEIVDFRNEFATRMLEIYDFDLWAAAFILGNGCSEDGFADFRSWLISMGREAFESAKKDPETLGDVAFLPGVEDIFFEEFQYIPGRADRDTTGHEIPEYPTPYPDTPRGQWIGDEDAALARRFPRLWAKKPTP